ncbi:ureidoglycolate lyase [Motiliproteus coralliicola]|uniref:Ureidoglycolate lyase n=1 Tax=Motiliproteus coralliicola TaxID=2283196 RepID=A0A369WTP0_9GAMM|nr:ureidoglycolate lyase [Motiliproteus coralliicola]RDE22865.1 ureidoglycolate lyase [Motiliproteus coralliicola]
MLLLRPEPLTQEAFAPYGDVIETAERDFFMINNGSTQRYHQLADVQLGQPEDRAIISIFRAQALPLPLEIQMVERHPQGSQAFIPLKGNPFLIVVAAAGDNPEPDQLRAFISNGQQGVNYHRGVWHHPVLCCVEEDDFLVVDRAGEGNNCDEHFFNLKEPIVLDPGAPIPSQR